MSLDTLVHLDHCLVAKRLWRVFTIVRLGVDTTSFLLVSLEVSYIVYTKTPGEKDAWVTDISHAIENLQKINRSYAGIVVCYSCVCQQRTARVPDKQLVSIVS